MNELIIKPEHVRNIKGYCMAGVKDFCRLHAIDFKQFIREGTPAQILMDSGDALAIQLLELAAHYELQKQQAGV